MLWRPLSVVLAAALAPSAQAASIVLPAPLTVSGSGTNAGTVYDTYVRGEELWVRTDYDLGSPTTACSISGISGTWSQPETGNPRWVAITIPTTTAAGIYTVSCTGASGTKSFRVLATNPHQTIWFGREDAASLAAKYQSSRPDLTRWNDGDQSGDSDEWIRRAGWWQVLNVAAYGYLPDEDADNCDHDGDMSSDADGHETLPRQSDGQTDCVQWPLSNPEDPSPHPLDKLVDDANIRDQAGVAYLGLLRLALAGVVADEYASSYNSDLQFVANATDYLDAAVFWGTTLTAVDPTSSDWTGLNDLYKARQLTSSAVAYDWLFPWLTPDERHTWLMGLAAQTDEFYNNGSYNLDRGDPDHWDGKVMIRERDVLLNGHAWENFSAVGIVAFALQYEMCGGASCADPAWNDWNDDAEAAMTQITSWVADDGSDAMGVYYSTADVRGLFSYYEAAETAPVPVGSPWWAADTFPHRYAKWLDYMTLPNGHRAAHGDGYTYTEEGPAWQMALTAGEFEDDLAQYWAWEGHPTHPEWTAGRRDVYDLLFADETGVPTKLTELQHDDRHPHACFPAYGQISVSQGWQSDDGRLVYQGGKLIGSHDDPAVGAFDWYDQGHMVTTDGYNNKSKRTSLHSTLRVDGHGQHGDGREFIDSVPQHANLDENNAYVRVYLDNTGEAKDGASATIDVNVVTFGSNLKPLYTVASTSTIDGRPAVTDVNALANRGTLTDLDRYMFWIDGNLVVWDRFDSTYGQGESAFRFDWSLTGAEYNYFNVGERSLPDTHATYTGTCGSGYYEYTTPSSGIACLKFPGDGTVDCESGCTDGEDVATVADFEPNLPPVPLFIPDPFTVSGGGTTATIEPLHTTGKVAINVADGLSTLTSRLTGGLDGGRIIGAQLDRSITDDEGYFITVMRPYTATTSAVNFSSLGWASGGGYAEILEHTTAGWTAVVTVVSPNETHAGSTSGDYDTVGRASVVVRDPQETKVYVAQLIDGTLLKRGGDKLIEANDTVSVGLTQGLDALWGTVDVDEDGTPSTTLKIFRYGRGMPTVSYRAPNGSWSTLSTTDLTTTDQVQFTVSGDGFIDLRWTGSNPQEPGSSCCVGTTCSGT